MEKMILGLRKVRDVFAQQPLAGLIKSEALPGADCTTDAQLSEHIRKFVKTVYHPMGTCRIGQKTDTNAVVDETFSVIGTSGLKVIDASVFTGPISGNTCMSVYAMARHVSKYL